MSKTRNSTIEMLRILSIIMIVSWHYATQFDPANVGGALASKLSIYHLFAIIVGSWGQLGVDLFLIISVYYLKQANKFSITKAILLISQTIFYALFWMTVCHIVLGSSFDIKAIIKAMLSLFFGTFWFVTAYFVMYCLSPFINNIIRNISGKGLERFSIALFLVSSVYKTVYKNAPVCDILFFISCYFLVCYLDDYHKATILKKSRKYFLITSIFLICVNISLVVAGELMQKQILIDNSCYLNQRGSFVVFLDAIFLFYLFLSLPDTYSKTINTIAGTSLGVYFCHQGVASQFWKHFLSKSFESDVMSILHMILSVCVIFLASCIIDIIRKYTFEKLCLHILSIGKINKVLIQINSYMNEIT